MLFIFSQEAMLLGYLWIALAYVAWKLVRLLAEK